MTKTYDKVYVLDTNIILNDVNNMEMLSQGSNNLIVLPETVLDELDDKKSGFDEINFQARNFARQTTDEEIMDIEHLDHITVVETKINNTTIHTISKEVYKADSDKVSASIRNDRKILEITKEIKEYDLYKDLIFLSLDGMARKRGVSLGIVSETLTISDDLHDAHERAFDETFEVENFNGDVSLIPETEPHISHIEVTDTTCGKRYYYYNINSQWEFIDDKNIDKLSAVPRNKGQKALSKIILDDYNDIIVATGPAGTGKNYVTLGAIARLMDLNKDKYTNILYLRKTVISGNKDDELGFLPGSLEEKMGGYTAPMEDSILSIVTNKYKKKMDKEEIDAKCDDFRDKYQINYGYMGHLRGSTFPKGTIVVLDEFQNWDYASAKTILSRVGENNKVIIMGSNNQIDTSFLSKHNNALTFMMSQCGVKNDSNVNIKGVNLTNVMRSKVAEWTDITFNPIT